MGKSARSKSAQKLLRIGVIQSGRIVEEHVIRPHRAVTVGDSPKNTIVLHNSGLPERFRLFAPNAKGYTLYFKSDMKLTLAGEEGRVLSDAEARAGCQTRQDGTFAIAIESNQRGKLVLADKRLLFQFIPPPPRARSSRSVRRMMRGRLDAVTASFFGLSVLLHSIFMLHAMAQPKPPPPSIVAVMDRFPDPIHFKIPKKLDKKDSEPEKIAEKPRKRKPEVTKVAMIPKDPKELERLRRDRVTNRGALSWLRKRKSAFNPTANGTKDLDLTTLLTTRNSKDAEYRVASTGPLLKGDHRDTELVGVAPVSSVRQDKVVSVEARQERALPATYEAPQVEDKETRGNLEVALGAYMPAITACYEVELKTNVTLSGKYMIEFVVEETGRVSSVEVYAASGRTDKDLAACIKNRVLRWKLPATEGGSTDVSLPVLLAPRQGV